MTDEFERLLLQTFPPEDLVEEDDPAYPEFEADSGCRVCTGGQPCQERIANDIHDILVEAGLPDTARLTCLQWMIEEGCSTLTHSITQMAAEFIDSQRTAHLADTASGLRIRMARE